ncbi:MAG: V-type ATP synthase subunit K [Oscillospiraceae bacterium]|jgi:V/A-type H+-transporting ATPase subunit K|nr:V-type ATP synthase subunit K [Oscillospiraceae bacterium]
MESFFTNFGGAGIAFLGAGLAAMFCCIGSARGTGIVGEAISGLLSEDPSASGKCILYQVMPGSQGLYGIVVFFITLVQMGVFGGGAADLASISIAKGAAYFASCLPMMFGGFLSAIYQGRVAAGCINIVAKQPDNSSKGMMHVVIVEFYALLPLLASILLLINVK